MKRYLSIALGLALVISVAGCGKATEKANEKIAEKVAEQALKANGNKDAKVDIKKDGSVSTQVTNEKGETTTMNIQGGGGSGTFSTTSPQGTTTIGEGAKVPDGFPKDVPVYAGAKVMASITNNENGGMFSLNLETTEPLAKVSEYYKKEMAAQGWKTEQTTEMGGDSPMNMYNYTKAETSVMVMAVGEKDKTTIALTVTKK